MLALGELVEAGGRWRRHAGIERDWGGGGCRH